MFSFCRQGEKATNYLTALFLFKDEKILENKRRRLEQKEREKIEKEKRLSKLRNQVGSMGICIDFAQNCLFINTTFFWTT